MMMSKSNVRRPNIEFHNSANKYQSIIQNKLARTTVKTENLFTVVKFN